MFLFAVIGMLGGGCSGVCGVAVRGLGGGGPALPGGRPWPQEPLGGRAH